MGLIWNDSIGTVDFVADSYIRIGVTGTPDHGLGSASLFITGMLEVDGHAYFDAGATFAVSPAITDFTNAVHDHVDAEGGGVIPAVADNTTHRTSDGTDHGFIDQDVTINATPEFDALDFDPQAAPLTHIEGRLYYDDVAKTLVLDNDESSVPVLLGRTIVRRVYNDTGSIIPRERVVSISGGITGGAGHAVLAIASDSITSERILGLTMIEIPIGGFGYTIDPGQLPFSDTSAWLEGDLLWLSATVPGGLTNVKPTAPNVQVRIGIVGGTPSPTEGVIGVKTILLQDINVKQDTSTGLNYGGELSISAELPAGTKFDIAAGQVIIVNTYTDPANISQTTLTWDAQIGLTVDNIGIQLLTGISVRDDGAGNAEFVQRSATIDVETSRDEAALGILVHPNLSTITDVSDSSKHVNTDVGLRGWDLFRALGGLKASGLQLTPNGTNLKFDRSAGTMHILGGNYSANRKNPNIVTTPLAAPVTFYLASSVGGPLGAISDVPTDKYEPNNDGVLVPIPSGWSTAHRVFYDASSNLVALQYGQHVYDSLKSAVDVHMSEVFPINPTIANLGQLGSIIVQEGATDLSDIFQARIANFGRLGATTFESVPDIDLFGEPVELLDALSYDRHEFDIVHDTGVLYAEIERIGGGDMTYIFGQHEFTLNCTTGAGAGGKARIALTAGADSSSPAENFVSVIRGTGLEAVLDVGSARPTGEYANVCSALLPDVTTWLASGEYGSQRNTEAKQNDGRSIIAIIQERLRVAGALYDGGVNPVGTIIGDVVDLTTIAGIVYQIRPQTWPIRQVSDDGIKLANVTGGTAYANYDVHSDLNLSYLADGVAIPKNRPFNLVVWGAQNRNSTQCKLYVNLATEYYSTTDAAYNDTNQSAVVSVPKELKGQAFLIARVPIMYTTGDAATPSSWTFVNPAGKTEIVPLLGNPIGVSGSGAAGAGNTFTDTLWEIVNSLDPTKIFGFDASTITTGTKRVYIAPDKDGTLALLSDLTVPATHAITHETGADLIEPTNLTTTGIDTNTRYAPDGISGTQWLTVQDRIGLGTTWQFDVTTSDADPGAGYWRVNNSTQSAATFLYLSYASQSGADLSSIFESLKNGDHIYVQENSDVARSHVYRVNGAVIDATTYGKIPVVSEYAGTAIRDDEMCGFITAPIRGVDVLDTPLNNQLAIWTNDNTIEGDSALTWDGTDFQIIEGTVETNHSTSSAWAMYIKNTGTGTAGSIINFAFNKSGGIKQNDDLGSINFYGRDPDATLRLGALIRSEAQEDWVGGGTPAAATNLEFQTTRSGGVTNQLALRLDYLGRSIFFNTATPDQDNQYDLGTGSWHWKDLYLKGSITDGTNSATVAEIVAGSFVPALGNAVYVDGKRDPSGEGYTEDGTRDRPWKTIQAANDAITGESASNLFTIIVAPAIYTENVVLATYVNLVGMDRETCIIEAAGQTLRGASTPGLSYIANITARNAGGTLTTDDYCFFANTSGDYYLDNCTLEIRGTSDGNERSSRCVNATPGDMIFRGCRFIWNRDGNDDLVNHSVIFVGGTTNSAAFIDCDLEAYLDVDGVLSEAIYGVQTDCAVTKFYGTRIRVESTDDGPARPVYFGDTIQQYGYFDSCHLSLFTGATAFTQACIYINTGTDDSTVVTKNCTLDASGSTGGWCAYGSTGEAWESYGDVLIPGSSGGVWNGVVTPTVISNNTVDDTFIVDHTITNSSGALTLDPTTYTSVGTGTPIYATGAASLYVTDEFEVAGASYFNGTTGFLDAITVYTDNLTLRNDVELYFGTSSNAVMVWSTDATLAADDQLRLGLSGNLAFSIMDRADIATTTGFNRAVPTLLIHGTLHTDYIEMYHDGTGGVLATSTGAVTITNSAAANSALEVTSTAAAQFALKVVNTVAGDGLLVTTDSVDRLRIDETGTTIIAGGAFDYFKVRDVPDTTYFTLGANPGGSLSISTNLVSCDFTTTFAFDVTTPAVDILGTTTAKFRSGDDGGTVVAGGSGDLYMYSTNGGNVRLAGGWAKISLGSVAGGYTTTFDDFYLTAEIPFYENDGHAGLASGFTATSVLGAINELKGDFAGAGDVSAFETPVNNQLAVWTDANTIEGDSALTWDGTYFTADGLIRSDISTAAQHHIWLKNTAATGTQGSFISFSWNKSGGMANGNDLGQFNFYGHDGTSGDQLGAVMRAEATEPWVGTNQGCSFEFLTNRNGSDATSLTLQLDGSGRAIFHGDIAPNTTVAAHNLGLSSNKWNDLYLAGNITDGTNTVAVSDLIGGSGAASQIAFWDGTQSITSDSSLKWEEGNESLRITGTTAGVNSIYIDNQSSTGSIGSDFLMSFNKATGVVDNDTLGRFYFLGHNGTAGLRGGALITAQAAETWSVDNHGTDIGFWATPIGAVSPIIAWRLQAVSGTVRVQPFVDTVPYYADLSIGLSTNRFGTVYAENVDLNSNLALSNTATDHDAITILNTGTGAGGSRMHLAFNKATGVVTNDRLFQIDIHGHDTVDPNKLGAAIRADAAEDWSASARGTNMEFHLVKTGQTATNNILTLHSSGWVTSYAHIRPGADSTYSCGGSSYRWTTTWTEALNASGDATIDGTITNTTGILTIAPADSYARIGAGSTSHSLDASGDLLVSGDFEANGTSYFDGATYLQSTAYFNGNPIFTTNIRCHFGGTGNDKGALLFTNVATTDQFRLGVPSTNKNFSIMDKSLLFDTTEFGNVAQPALLVHGTIHTNYVEMYHDGTDSVLSTSTGTIAFNDPDLTSAILFNDGSATLDTTDQTIIGAINELTALASPLSTMTERTYTSSTTISVADTPNTYAICAFPTPGNLTLKFTGSATVTGRAISITNQHGFGAPFGTTVQPNTGETFVFADGSSITDTGSIVSTEFGAYLRFVQTEISSPVWTLVEMSGSWTVGGSPAPVMPIASRLINSTSIDHNIGGGSYTISAANGSKHTLHYISGAAFTLVLDANATVDMDVGDKVEIVVDRFLSTANAVTIDPSGESVYYPHDVDSSGKKIGTSGMSNTGGGARIVLTLVDDGIWLITEMNGEWYDIDSGDMIPGHFAQMQKRDTGTASWIFSNEQTIIMTTLSNATVQLKSVLEYNGRRVTIKKKSVLANSITVTSESSANIEGSASYVFTTARGARTFEYNSTDGWLLVASV